MRRRRNTRERDSVRQSVHTKRSVSQNIRFERKNWIPSKERRKAHSLVLFSIRVSLVFIRSSISRRAHDNVKYGRRQPTVQNARVHQRPRSRDHRRRETHRGEVFSLRSTHESRPRRRRGVSKTDEEKKEDQRYDSRL